jgi:hypothetical protein
MSVEIAPEPQSGSSPVRTRSPRWREGLTVAAQVAAIVACCGVITVATITLLNYFAQ